MTAPRKPTADSANAAAAASPSSVGFKSAKPFSEPGRSAAITTPAVAIRIAITFSTVKWSLRKMNPKIAVWIASVFRYAVVTTNERSFIASSIMPVPTIWLSAPSNSHGRHAVAGHGYHDREEDDRERKAEQEADIGRAPGPEWSRQRPLHRIAGDLAE